MTDLQTAAQQALEALKAMQSYAAAERKGLRICDEAITALCESLEPDAHCVTTPDGECVSTDSRCMHVAPAQHPAEPVQEPLPWEHLKQYGYAPGDYMSRCRICDKIASGVDKRAITCRPCAEVRHAESQRAEQEKEPVVWLSPASQSMIGRDDGEGSAYHIITTSKATGNHTIPLYTAAPARRKPLTEGDMYIVEEEAMRNFHLSQSGPRGQTITYWDSLIPWLIRAVERAHDIKE